MQKRLVTLTLTSALALSLLAGVPAGAAGSPTSYVLTYSGDSLPANYQDAILQAGGVVTRAIPEIGMVTVEASNNGFLEAIRADANVQKADRDLTVRLEERPMAADGQKVDLSEQNGNYHHLQWDIQRVTNNFQTHNIETGNADTVIAVIDTGIDFSHPDLQANVDLAGSKTFVPGTTDAWDGDGHGTHVAGAIAANGKVVGVGPNLKLRAYRVFGPEPEAQQSWITDAIVTAANDGVEVINLSLGGWLWLANNFGEPGQSASMVAYLRAVRYAVQKGVTVVAAAGNHGLNLSDQNEIRDYIKNVYGLEIKGPLVLVPAQLPGVISVSSSNRWSVEDSIRSNDNLSFYSNYGNTIEVAAPGGDIGPVFDALYRQSPRIEDWGKADYSYSTLSTFPTYFPQDYNPTTNAVGYSYLLGTSMAAPKVAGIAGLIKAAHPEYSPAQVTALIRRSAIDYGPPGEDPLFGSGEVNAFNALTR